VTASNRPGVRPLAGSRVVVTGGAGVVGSHVVDLLVREGAGEIVVVDELSRGRPENLAWATAHGPVSLVQGDVRDAAGLAAVVAGADVVFHQAAVRITRCAEEPRLALEVLVDGTFNVAEACVAAGVGRLVLASSAAVYGAAPSVPIAETEPTTSNRTLYGAAKLFGEGLARSLHDSHGLEYVALRYFNVYGPRMDVRGPHTEVLVRWIERIADGEPPLILGDGTQTMDLVYVEDVARANLLAASAPVTDEVYNVGTGVETSLNDLARALLRVMGSGLEPEHGPARAVNDVPRRVADTRRARRDLGFEADVGLEEGLAALVSWWRAEREAEGRPA
jgi:UDP-glucose 4-epimerase